MTETTTAEVAAVAAAAATADAAAPALIPEAAPSKTKVSIKEAVLAQFAEAEQTINVLVEKYRNVAFAVTTTKGMKEAKEARADLRDNGRLHVTKSEERIKGEVNDLKRVMASEVARLVAIVKPHEDAVDTQIKAEETRKANEKAERDRIEAERIALHKANLETLAGYAAQTEGRSAEDIEKAIGIVAAIEIGDEWQEFKAQAEQAKAASVEAMQKALATEHMRAENARMAAELEANRRAMAEQAAELKRQQDAILATRIAQTHAIAFSFPAEEAIPALEQTEPEAPAEPVDPAPIQMPVHYGFARRPAPSAQPTTEPEQPTPEAPAGQEPEQPAPAIELMTTGELCKRLEGNLKGLTLTTEFVKALGFTPVQTKKPGTHWVASDLAMIGAALINHIREQISADMPI